jgi:signal transduction histidine kinase
MIQVRFIVGVVAGLFCLVLGLFALSQNFRSRLNRLFAYYNFANAFWNLSGLVIFAPDPATALLMYRPFQICGAFLFFFLIGFIQEFMGIYDQRGPTIFRRFVGGYLLLVTPLYLTPLFIADLEIGYSFIERPGLLYPLHLTLLAICLIILGVNVIKGYRRSSGIKRQQFRIFVVCLVIGACSMAFYILSFVALDVPWIYFPLQMVSSFCMAYAIYRYRLFEFSLWMNRMTVFVGVYLILLSVPFLLNLFFRDWFHSHLLQSWLFFPVSVAVFAVLFSLIPTLATLLRDKAEQKRLADFRFQMDVVKTTTEKLANEPSGSVEEVSKRVVDLLRRFYFERNKNPVEFIFFFSAVDSVSLSTATFPEHEVYKDPLYNFSQKLKTLPLSFLSQPFSRADVENLIREMPENVDSAPLETVRQYLSDSRIDITCPCLHDGKLYGAILLGPKEKGIFWPEELQTLQMASSHVAVGIRKTELMERTKQLRDLDMMKKELISNVTHEFKSPLCVVDDAVQMLEKEAGKGPDKNGKMKKYFDMIRSNVGRLEMFIENLLEIAKIDQANIDLKLEACDLREVVEDCVGILRPLATSKGITLRCDGCESLPIVLDPDKIQQVFNNLLSNAIKFTEKGGVAISLKGEDKKATVTIKDTGLGIEKEYLSSVFDRFFQAPTNGSRSIKGTGLGLAIAKGWVEAHHGHIEAESDGIGQGTTFTVTLPTDSNL